MPTQVQCPYCQQAISGASARCPVCRNPLPWEIRAEVNAQRTAEQAKKEARKAEREAERDFQARRRGEREADVERKNRDLECRISTLSSLLAASLNSRRNLGFDALKERLPDPESLHPGLIEPSFPRPVFEAPPEPSVPAPSAVGRLFGGGKRYEAMVAQAAADYEKALANARQKHDQVIAVYERHERERDEQIAEAQREIERRQGEKVKAAERQHAEVEELRKAVRAGDPHATADYFRRIIEVSPYPPDFEVSARAAYVKESRQLVVELTVPSAEVVPAVKNYRYVKGRDEVVETPISGAQVRALYGSVVAQVSLRCLREVFGADQEAVCDTVALSCFVETIDRAIGKPVRPCLVTVRTTKQSFEDLDLAKVDPEACLRALNASVSRSPSELLPVRPLVDFSMVDPRFVGEADILSALDSRPNLMVLTPSEFESLITNLFGKMGLETRLTQASRDGGVDCVAWDNRPILGGKIVIQAKRYKNTVGVSAVRDLFGTMQNEGASKGILVTTSGFGRASFEFAEGKPIELLSGANLLYLLEEHAGIKARIEAPEDWLDPSADIDESPL